MNIIKHNGVPCVEAKVHMLPTATYTVGGICKRIKKLNPIIHKTIDVGDIIINDNPEASSLKEFIPQHLYITTDEEINAGDYIYGKDMKDNIRVEMATCLNPNESWDTDKGGLPLYETRKIIATTDPKFRNSQYTKEELGGATPKIYGLPQIPQSFIEEYCKAGGIDKVLVEYTTKEFRVIKGGTDLCMETKTTIKTDSNNCIIIHPVEEKMYSREEVEAMLILAYNLTECSLNEWIKENL